MCVLRTAVAPSLSLDQRHGTCSKTICVSRTCELTVFVVHWRRVFLISTRHIERIRGAFCDDALYKLTFTLPADASLCFESSTVYLLHQVDTRGKCGHFDLLVGKNTMNKRYGNLSHWIRWQKYTYSTVRRRILWTGTPPVVRVFNCRSVFGKLGSIGWMCL